MVKIVPSHPHLVAEYQDTILASVNDEDISIRMRALDLVSAMVNIFSQSCIQSYQFLKGKPGKSSIHCTADPIPPSPGFIIDSFTYCRSVTCASGKLFRRGETISFSLSITGLSSYPSAADTSYLLPVNI